MMVRAALRWGWALALLAGCHHSTDDLGACEGVSGATVTRMVEHPGAGHEVTVRLGFQDGVPIGEADLVRCLSVSAPASSAPPVVTARPLTSAYTLLLVDPGQARQTSDLARAFTEQIVRRRPAGEGVAVYRWAAEITQVAAFGTDRSVLLSRLPIGLPGTDMVAPARAALTAAAAVLGEVGGAATDALRTIVLVSPRAAALAGLAEALPAASPHLVVWVGGSDQAMAAAALPPGLRFPLPGGTAPASVVATLSDRLDAYKRFAHYGVGLCGGEGEQAVRIDFRGAPGASLSLPPPMAENLAGDCQPDALAAGRRAFPGRLELLFSPAQRTAAAAAHEDRAARPSFELAVRVAPEAEPTAATARYRDDASYDCARHSYTVELEGAAPRFFFPGSASRKLHLLSLCRDRLYLRTLTALSVMAEEGLFPVPFDMVELAVDGVSQGLYLAVEDAPDALRVRSSRVRAVMRRDPTGQVDVPEVMFSATTAADAVASYRRILDVVAPLGGQRLENAVRERFDIDRYLDWLALMNLLGSGGYANQIFLYSVETTGVDGLRADYHLLTGADLPTLFDACAAQGRQTLVDPNGLLECTEAELDRKLFADSVLYGHYVDHLEALLDRQSPERFAARVDATARRVLGFLANPEALAALVELRDLDAQATTRPEVARALLEAERELVTAQYAARRSSLLAGLARFRGAR